MEKPQVMQYLDGKYYCNKSQLEIIEYILWEAKLPMRAGDVMRVLSEDYKTNMTSNNICTRMTDLVAQGRAAKFGRGLYIHKDALFE